MSLIATGVALLGSACTAEAPPEQPPSSTPTAPDTAAPLPEGDGFTFDDAAEFEGGLTVEIAGAPLARNAGSDEKGAEGTNGELVVVAVLITNDGDEPFPADQSLVTLQYQGVDDAPLIFDAAGELQAGFSEPVPPGSDATATLGFAVPFSAIDAIAVTIDPGDELNEPVTFTGAAEREDEGG